jgi:magnesium-transporting ATPase (P-type)
MAEVEEKKVPFPYHAKSKEEVFKELNCADNILSQGLTSEDAKARLSKYGTNQMSTKAKVTLCKKIYDQIANVLVGILIFVAIVSVARALTATTTDNIVSNWIQVGLIVFVIT